MTTQFFSRDRLQPALLDRLIDDQPDKKQAEPAENRTISKTKLRQSVLRDLSWLLNATGSLYGLDESQYGHALRSSLNFGLPPISGTLVSSTELTSLEHFIHQAIVNFEPRIVPATLQVNAIEPDHPMNHHNTIVFEISGQLWAQPYPLDVLFKTSLDLETGATRIDDTNQLLA